MMTRIQRNAYNKHNRQYAAGQPAMRPFTATDIYLIMKRKLYNGRQLSDKMIARLLRRSVQAVQVKRCNLNQQKWGRL